MGTDARISRFPPRNIIVATTSVASDSTLLADGARNSRGRVHQLPRLSPPATASLEVDQICPDSPLRERHSNRPRYRDHRYRDLMHRVLPRFVLCVFSQSCLKARLHLLLMPCCCWISFIDTIKPRGGIYFILIFIQGEEMVIWWKGIWGISSSGKSINFLPFLSFRDKRDYFIKA